jgi:hypothetical protein
LDDRLKLNLKVALTSSIGIAVLYTLLQFSGFDLVAITDVLFVLVSGICTFFALRVVLKFGGRGKFGSVHTGLFLAVLFWCLGEAIWGIYEVGLRIPIPFPSLADVFYLAGYLPAIISILLALRLLSRGLTEIKMLVSSLLGLMIIGLVFSFLLNPLLSNSTGALTAVLDLAYPSLDSILLILAIMMLLIFEGAPPSTPWLWISVGMILTTIGDISFSLGTLQGWYYSGHPVELLWLWGYIALALGFDYQRKQFD